MGAPTVSYYLQQAQEAHQREMELIDAYRVALEACARYAEQAMNNARDAEKFKAARSAHRLACAALGRDHD
jgi:hypothetical protein